jgi:predicted nucleic acid-binding protein
MAGPVPRHGAAARRGAPLTPGSVGRAAAIALANAMPLFTCNPSDFAGIDGLTVVAIPHPGPVASG